MRTVEDVLAELGLKDRPTLVVFHKLDGLPDPAAFANHARSLHPDAIFTSAMRTDGLQPLRAELRGRAEAIRPVVKVYLDPSDGKRLGQIHRVGDVLGQALEGERLAVTVRLEPWRAEQLRRDGLQLEPT
jgi:GTP-binding protein HflX